MDNLFLFIYIHDKIHYGGKMKRSIIYLLFITLVLVTGCSIKDNVEKVKGKIESVGESIPLMEFSDFKNIVVDKVKSIDYTRYTEGGSDTQNITDKEEIQRIYNSLSNMKVGKEVTNACEDNTKIYSFNIDDGKKIKIELECEWLVIGNKRYEVK